MQVYENSVALWLHSVNGTFVSYPWHDCARYPRRDPSPSLNRHFLPQQWGRAHTKV